MLAVLALAALFTLALWLPHQVRAARLRARIASARGMLGVDGSAGGGLPQLARDVADLRRAASLSKRHVPHGDELGPLLRLLSAELDSLGVSQQELQTQPIARGGNYNVIPVGMRFRSTFATAQAFLRRVEGMNRLVRVTRVEFRGARDPETAAGAGDPVSDLEVLIDLCAFSAPAGKEGTP